MGYTTDFSGQFKLDKPLTVEHYNKLNEFADTRHGGNATVDEDKPGFWCQWRPTENGDAIEWDGGEKFYHYHEWLAYLIEHFIEPWGYKLNGSVKWFGEDRGDVGEIIVTDNQMEIVEA